MSLVSHLESIYQAAIRAVSPYKLVYEKLSFLPSEVPLTCHGKPTGISGILKCGDHSYEVDANVKSEIYLHHICLIIFQVRV